MREKIKKLIKYFRLKHHCCENNLQTIQSYTEATAGGSIHRVTICKCKICGERVDID